MITIIIRKPTKWHQVKEKWKWKLSLKANSNKIATRKMKNVNKLGDYNIDMTNQLVKVTSSAPLSCLIGRVKVSGRQKSFQMHLLGTTILDNCQIFITFRETWIWEMCKKDCLSHWTLQWTVFLWFALGWNSTFIISFREFKFNARLPVVQQKFIDFIFVD